jgi:hypothetical protein
MAAEEEKAPVGTVGTLTFTWRLPEAAPNS